MNKAKMSIPEKLTVRLGTLREHLEKACNRSGNSASEEIRIRLARSLKVPRPDMRSGAAGHGEGCECVSCKPKKGE